MQNNGRKSRCNLLLRFCSDIKSLQGYLLPLLARLLTCLLFQVAMRSFAVPMHFFAWFQELWEILSMKKSGNTDQETGSWNLTRDLFFSHS